MFDSRDDAYYPQNVAAYPTSRSYIPDGHSPMQVQWNATNLLYYELHQDDYGGATAKRGHIRSDTELDSWLFGSQTPSASKGKASTLRLLVCERESYNPISFSMTAKAFDRVAQDFMFPVTAVHVLANNGGILTRSLIRSSQAPNLVLGIQIMIKAWQNSAIGNFGLVMSFDVTTRMTSAFLHGTGVTNGAGFEQLCVVLRESSPAGLSHPLLLPSILLWQHLRRMQPVVVKFEDAVIDAEGQLGVVRSGRHRTTPVVRRKENFEQLTRNIYTVLTDILFVKHCCDWQKSLEGFLSDILETASHDGWTPKSSEFTRYLHKHLLAETQWLNEGIANLASETASMASLLEQLRTRIEKQPEVMYNRVNANMAVTSIKDNTTMKTLAVIAAVFLPGTYIATVFSMSMFDWQLHKGDNDSSSRMMSSNFWIYWAVSIPLTVLVITLGWLFWTWNQNRSARLVMDDIKAMEHGLPRRRNSPTRDSLSPMDRIAASKAKGGAKGHVVAGASTHAKPEAYELVLTLQGWKEAASLIRTRGQAQNAQVGQGSSLGIPARGGATAADSSKTKKTSSYWDDEDM